MAESFLKELWLIVLIKAADQLAQKQQRLPCGTISRGGWQILCCQLFCGADIAEFSHRAVADCSYQGRRSIGAKTARDREVAATGCCCHSSGSAAVKYLTRVA